MDENKYYPNNMSFNLPYNYNNNVFTQNNNSKTFSIVKDLNNDPEYIMQKTNAFMHDERYKYYDEVFSEINIYNFEQDYQNKNFLREYDEYIQGKVDANKNTWLENKAFKKDLNKEVKRYKKKYVSKDKDTYKAIGDPVDFYSNISEKKIKQLNEEKAKNKEAREQKELEWEKRREKAQKNRISKEEYTKLFEEADYMEALEDNKKFDELKKQQEKEALQQEKEMAEKVEEYTKLFDEADVVEERIDKMINKAIVNAQSNSQDDIQTSLNRLVKDHNKKYKKDKSKQIDAKTLSKAKHALSSRYDDLYLKKADELRRLNRLKDVNLKPGSNTLNFKKDQFVVKATDEGIIGISKNEIDSTTEFVEGVEKQVKKNAKKSLTKNIGHVANIVAAGIDFKDARESGHSVIGSVAKAGAEFVKGELLGGWYFAAMAAQALPSIAISAVEGVATMSRSMNSSQRTQVFANADFVDTQQLATMRQSGMELAKMSQYNLQQTLMGNEAEYLHRL